MRRLLALLLAALSPVAAAASSSADDAAQETAAPLPGTWHLVQHTLADKSWGGRPSHTILAPKGWKVEGGAWYPPVQAFQCFASHEVTITAPDGSTIEIDPELSFVDRTMTTMQGRQRLPHGSISDGRIVLHRPTSTRSFGRLFKKELLPAERPNAKRVRVKEVTELKELTEQLRTSLQPIRAQFAQNARMSPGMTTEVDGSVIGVELEYVEDGQTWSHVVVFAQTHYTFETPSVMASWGDTSRDRHTSWGVSGSLAIRAPKGQVEDLVHVAAVIRQSLVPTGPWMQMQARHRAKIMKINHEIALDNMRTAANISRISAKANSDILDIQAGGHRRREAIRDEIHAKQINSIHEVHEYRVPGEDLPVALPSYYDRVFSNGSGEYLMTNDANYEPGTDLSLGGQWSALERVR